MYVCVCFGLSLRVHSGPADHAVRPNPRAGGCNRRSRGLPAVTLPILCTLAAIYVLRFERRFGLSKSLASVLLSRLLHLTCNYVQNLCFCPFCVHLPHAFSFYNIYVMGVALGLRQVYTKWAIRRRPRCPPGVP